MRLPITDKALREMQEAEVLRAKPARDVMRKSGFRPGGEGVDPPPTPILSLEGIKRGCSVELQSLINDFHDDGHAAYDALIEYIETELGETIESAYPDEWEAAQNGEPQTIEIDLGSDIVTLSLGQCGFSAISLNGQYDFDITASEFSHPDNAQAWTTGRSRSMGEDTYALNVSDSDEIHLGQGQTALVGSVNVSGSSVLLVEGVVKAWRKSPRRVLDIDPVVVHVPNSSAGSHPIQATLRWEGSSPRHGEFLRFYNNTAPVNQRNQVWLWSEVGPPVYFGILLRSDAQVAAGHPLTEWWFDMSSSTAPGPVDAFSTTGASLTRISGIGPTGTGAYRRQNTPLSLSSTDSEIDTEFDDFYDDIYANERPESQDSNVEGETVTLTDDPSFSGWACFWWWHPDEDWYWRTLLVTGQRASSNISDTSLAAYRHGMNQSNYDPTSSGSPGEWNTLQNRAQFNLIKSVVPSGPADETVEYLFPGETGDIDTDNRGPSRLGRGPWARIAPGAGAGACDARCITPGAP